LTKINNFTLTIVLGFITAFSPLSIDMYLSSLPTLEKYFSVGANTIQLTLASFFIGFSAGQLFYGPISDKYGRKTPLYFGISLFMGASIGCAMSSSIEWMIFFRFLQALGACSGGVIARAVVRDVYLPQDAAKIYSYLMLVTGLAPMLAPVVGGYILTHLGWKAIFLTLAFTGLVSVVLVKLWLVDSSIKNSEKSLAPKEVMAEYLHLLKHKHFMAHAALIGFATAGMFAYIASSPFVFMNFFGLSVTRYGWLFGANALSFVISAQINARLVKKVNPSTLIWVSLVFMTIFGTAMFMSAVFGIGGFYAITLPLLGVMSCIGFIMPNANAVAMAPFSSNAGSASALLGTIQFSMAAISAISLGAIKEAALVSMSGVIMLCGMSAVALHVFIVKTQREIEIEETSISHP
jgi:DHA1 family bicyclomycin/chloramphenicol resistance-like MFS transporter